MKPRPILLLFSLFLVAVVLCALPDGLMGRPASRSAVEPPVDAGPINPASDTCYSTFTSGSGPTYFKWCVTQNGNIVSLESPQGVEHIRGHNIQEGYSICNLNYDPVPAYWDFADGGSSGWGTSVIVQPNGLNTLPLTIKRTTTDGMVELDQKFSQNIAEKSIQVKMTVFPGCWGSCPTGLWVFRYANIDANNTNINYFDQSADSAWSYNSGKPGVMLSAMPAPASYYTKRSYLDGAGAFPLSAGPPSACQGNSTTGPFHGDGAVEAYQFFWVPAASSGTVGFEYKRF